MCSWDLSTGESAAGSFGSTTRTQLSQDFLTKVAGELATLTAPTVTTADTTQQQQQQSNSSSRSSRTVICTELHAQGKFSPELYNHPTAVAHFMELDERTVQGYQCWAVHVVSLMKKSPLLCAILRPIVLARYLQIIYGQRSILGSATIYLGQPLCWIIGAVKKEKSDGSAVY